MTDQFSDLKKLRSLLILCRKQGVTELEMGDMKIKFGDLPNDNSSQLAENEVESDNPYANFPDGILTPDQLAYYSAGGLPENDPTLGD